MAKKKKEGYFNNEEVLEFFKRRNHLKSLETRTREEDRELWKIKEKLGVLYFKISEGLLRRPNFCNYDIATKSEMISDAVFNCLKAGDNYDVKFDKPHAYFTQISWNAFILNIKNLKKRSGLILPLSHIENMEAGDDGVGE